MEIYYEGNLDYIATYKLKAKKSLHLWTECKVKPVLVDFYDKLNFFFANSRWPQRGEV